MGKAEDLDFEAYRAANGDLEERMESLPITVTYDSEFDIFLLSIGNPQEAITEEVPDGHGLQLRLDPETLKVVGFEIMGFQARYLAVHPEFRAFFDALFNDVPFERRDIPPKGQRHREATAAARHLSPALP